jgi:phage recombination protein Bet
MNTNLPVLAPPRLPYHPAIEERFGVDKSAWKALVESIFPSAKTPDSVVLALSYCKARKLDPFKRPVHIVGIYDSQAKEWVDTVWPGIGELRTTAFRTGLYAGRDKTEFGPTIETTFTRRDGGNLTIQHPEWAQVTVYRMMDMGQGRRERMGFPGPTVYWVETCALSKGVPNSMWQTRKFGQLDKCAEAAALRAAFPEEIGNDMTSDEMQGQTIDGVATHVPDRPAAATEDRVRDLQAETIEDAPVEPEDEWTLVDEVGEVITSSTSVGEVFDAYIERLPQSSDPAAFRFNNQDLISVIIDEGLVENAADILMETEKEMLGDDDQVSDEDDDRVVVEVEAGDDDTTSPEPEPAADPAPKENEEESSGAAMAPPTPSGMTVPLPNNRGGKPDLIGWGIEASNAIKALPTGMAADWLKANEEAMKRLALSRRTTHSALMMSLRDKGLGQ